MSERESVPGDKSEITSELLEKFLEHPAPMANRAFLSIMGTAARLTFAEQALGEHPTKPVVRTAVAMPLNDLLSLRDLLNKNLAGIELEPAEEDRGDGG